MKVKDLFLLALALIYVPMIIIIVQMWWKNDKADREYLDKKK